MEKVVSLYTITEVRKYYREFDLSVFSLLDIEIPEVSIVSQKPEDSGDSNDDEDAEKEEDKQEFEVSHTPSYFTLEEN